MKLWYEQPAKRWIEALPIGNGRLGGMVYGKMDTEVISLNEDTLWSGCPRNLNPKNKSEFFLKAVELAKNKDYHAAQELIENELTSGWTQSYMPLGDLKIDFDHKQDVTGYTRSLDLETAVARVEYAVDDVNFKREIFASAPDHVIVINISSDTPRHISFTLGFDCQLKSKTIVKDGLLLLKGEAPSFVEPSYSGDHENPVNYSDNDEARGMLFVAMVKVKPIGGIVSFTDTTVTVKDADSITLLVNARTSFAGYYVQPYLQGREYENRCLEELNLVFCLRYEELMTKHIADYKSYYDRVYLNLGESDFSALPTDERLYNFRKDQNDLSLYTLLFQYGRYLLISSSREGTQPANLQGIWNSELRPPWSSNYTININTQMNYWPAFACALGDLQQPLVELIKELSITGKVTAQDVYGARGFTSHHNSDIWRLASPVGNHRKGSACFAYWNMSAGWLCRHLFDQYEYTLNIQFFRDVAYPIMKSAAEFLMDIMTEDKDGYWIICPSTSPENTFIYEGKRCNIAETTTMTMTITKELFKNCIKSCKILDCDTDFAEELQSKIEKLYPYKVGSKGQLLEWNEEYEEAEPDHRHISHLYGLHPASEITAQGTPELAQACRNSLNLRGDDGTGWSLGWKINQWARLLDGDRALKLLNRQLRVVEDTGFDYSKGGGTYINLLDAHPPFQIDGNFGATSGIAEMLLQSHDNEIYLLPALPKAWGNGSVKGLRAKGGFEIDMSWEDGELHEAVIYSQYRHPCSIHYKEKSLALDMVGETRCILDKELHMMVFEK